jgi:hypothetical protein
MGYIWYRSYLYLLLERVPKFLNTHRIAVNAHSHTHTSKLPPQDLSPIYTLQLLYLTHTHRAIY